MAQVTLYTKENCPYCRMAKQLLSSRQVSFEEVRVDLHPERQKEMEQLSGKQTLPQIFINQQPIGGYDDLAALATSGQLDQLLT
jgi:glutaredoxin 3